MARKITYTDEELEGILKRYIYGEPLGKIAEDLNVTFRPMAAAVRAKYRDVSLYRKESVIVYLQDRKRNVADAAKHFNLTEAGVHRILRERFGGDRKNPAQYRDVPLEELRNMRAPFEQDTILAIEERQRTSHAEAMTKEQRTARAREIHLRVNERVRKGREHLRTDKLYRAAIRKLYG